MIEKELIFTDCIIENLKKEDVLKFFANKISDITKFDENMLFNSLLERENISATSIGEFIAIPHAKIENLKEAKIAIFLTDKKILWDEAENEKANIFIIMLSPKNSKNNIHLTILSKIARKLFDEEFVSALKNKNKDEIYNIMKNIIEI